MDDPNETEAPAEAEQPHARKADPVQRDLALHLVNVAGQMFSQWRMEMMKRGASPNSDSLLASAMATYTGTIIGELIGTGVLQEASLDCMLDTLRANMLEGVEAGKRKVARVAREVLGTEATGESVQ